jgi:pimeloyl-ACP methyl ester carboxylesterase
MGGFLSRLITEADLGRPHIVAPDVGTAAALFAAAAHPEQIASLIVGAGATAVPLQLGEPLASWVLDPDLDKYRHVDPTPSSTPPWTPTPATSPTTSVPTTWPPTKATGSSSR